MKTRLRYKVDFKATSLASISKGLKLSENPKLYQDNANKQLCENLYQRI